MSFRAAVNPRWRDYPQPTLTFRAFSKGTLEIIIRWDRRSQLHILRHGISPEEVDAIVSGDAYIRRHRGRLVAIGRAKGRVLLVVLRPHRHERLFYSVVTARIAKDGEKRSLARRGKRRR